VDAGVGWLVGWLLAWMGLEIIRCVIMVIMVEET